MDAEQWSALLKRLDKQDDQAAERSADLVTIKLTLAEQHHTLEDHTRRSLAAEEALELLKAEVKPIALHVAVVGALGKIIVFSGSALGLVAGVLKLLGKG
jgi:hypothetical protein